MQGFGQLPSGTHDNHNMTATYQAPSYSGNSMSYPQMRNMPMASSEYNMRKMPMASSGYEMQEKHMSSSGYEKPPFTNENEQNEYRRQDMCAPNNSNIQYDDRMEEQSTTNPNEEKKTKAFLSSFTNAPISNMNADSEEPQQEEAKVVFPGMAIPLNPNIRTRIGRGLLQHNKVVIASKCGILRSKNKSARQQSLWLENSQKKYEPAPEDLVVGTVIEKRGMEYTLDLGGTKNARLPHLAFEGATARNKPNIAVGALVYCRVNFVCKDMDSEVTCISDYVKRDWITGENLFGELKGGYCFKVSLKHAIKLLDENCLVLRCLANYVPFEIAVGQNGRVWINSREALHTILITNSILNSEHMNDQMTIQMVKTLFDEVQNA